MSMQIALEKSLSQVNFLLSSIIEKYDLTSQVKEGDRILIRQGDLIVCNYTIENYRKRGLRRAFLNDNNGILNFAGSHFIIPEGKKTVLIHNEHGMVIIPEKFENLRFYTINNAID